MLSSKLQLINQANVNNILSNIVIALKRGEINMNNVLCGNVIICSNSTTTTTGVILIPNGTIKNLTNTGNYRLILACNIPNATSNLPVFIQTASGNIPVLCKYGNTIYANQLNKRVNYPIGYGNANSNYTLGQFVITSCCGLNKLATTTTTTNDTTTATAKASK